MKVNKTMEGHAVPNHRRRQDKESESNIDSAAIKPSNKNNNKMTGITTYVSILTLNVN
jgi:hypothetical protein